MLTGVIVMVGSFAPASSLPRESLAGVPECPEMLGGDPMACVEILGKSVLERIVHKLQGEGVKAISVVADERFAPVVVTPITRRTRIQLSLPHNDLQSAAECVLREYVEQGIELIMLIRLGPYVEFDLAELVCFHRDRGQLLTPVADRWRSLPMWTIDARRLRQTQSTGIGDWIDGAGVCHAEPYIERGYVNPLETAQDLRRLVADAFLSRCTIRPSGRETKPGIWLDDGAQLHRRARIVAPAYLGCGTKVRAHALITRCSNVERQCELDTGTVVEAASILKNTYLGRGLQVSHAVIDKNKFLHLRHNLVVAIEDPRLLSRTVPSEPSSSSAGATAEHGFARRLLAAAWSQVAQ